MENKFVVYENWQAERKAVVHYFGAIFDVEFEIEENEQCQKTIH